MKIPFLQRDNTGKGAVRTFRLTFLEVMLALLVGLGGLYLLAVWMGVFSLTEPEVAPKPKRQVTQSDVDRALAADQRSLARLLALEQANSELSRQVRDLSDKLAKAGAAADDEKLAALNKRLDALAAAKGQADPELAKRIEAMHKDIQALDNLSKRLDELAKKAAQPNPALSKRLDGVEKGLAEAATPNPALTKRLDEMEQRLTKAAQPDPALVERVAALEEKLAQRPAPDARLVARLDALEKQLEGLEGLPRQMEQLQGRTETALKASGEPSAALLGRLERLEDAVAQLGKAQRATAQVAGVGDRLRKAEADLAQLRKQAANPETDPRLAKRLDELAQEVAAMRQAAQARAGLEAKVATLEQRVTALGRPTGPSPDLTQLTARLARLEEQVIEARRAATQPVGDEAKILARLRQLETRLGSANTADMALQQRELAQQLDAVQRRQGELTALVRRRTGESPAPAPRQTAQAPASRTGSTIIHEVEAGDTLYGISRRYDVKLDQMRAWNPQLQGRGDTLYIGEKVIIRPGNDT